MNIAIKPGASGLFVFSFHNFNILAFQRGNNYVNFIKNVENNLNNLKRQDLSFLVSGNALYIYIRDSKKYEDDTFCSDVFDIVIDQLLLAMQNMEQVINNYLVSHFKRNAEI